MFRLVCCGREEEVRKVFLVELALFDAHPELFCKPSYEVSCDASEAAFRDFVRALRGEEVAVTRENFAGLRSLSGEFGFKGLEKALSEFAAANPSLEREESLQRGVSSLLKRVSAQEQAIESLKAESLSARRSDHSDALASAVRALEARVKVLEETREEGARREEALIAELRARDARFEELRVRMDGVEARAATRSDLASLKAAVDSLKSGERGPTATAKSPQVATTSATAKSLQFHFTGDAFGGIIAALTRECGGNVDEKGVVAVTARDRFCDDDACHERNAVDLENKESCYMSKSAPGAWLCLDFKARRVKPTHYSIRTAHVGKGECHLKSWVIEGSLDGSGWSELDRRENNKDLNGAYKEKTFPVSKSGEFRFIRLRSIGKEHYGYSYLICSAFEVFGTLLV